MEIDRISERANQEITTQQGRRIVWLAVGHLRLGDHLCARGGARAPGSTL